MTSLSEPAVIVLTAVKFCIVKFPLESLAKIDAPAGEDDEVNVIVLFAVKLPPPLNPNPETLIVIADRAIDESMTWLCDVDVTAFVDVELNDVGFPSVIVTFDVSVPPPVIPNPAITCLFTESALSPTTS